ncbi:MAG TPA: gamma-glutamyltransferase [Woeseiaceae bacterium]|nr:gamma-glutamyltransferase [Woeseiaceae bacterium]
MTHMYAIRHLIAVAASAALLLATSISDAAGRNAVRGKNGVVATSSAIASEVGVEILKKGGNAVDAAVATAFALAVTWPSAGNIGGGGFLVYYGADGDATTFDFREKAPLAATENMYLNEDGSVRDNSNHVGILAVGVPGTVAGLAMAHSKYGKLRWSELLAPAVRLAREGFPLTWKLQGDFKNRKDFWDKYPSSAKSFLKKDGSFYEPGDLWVQADLANTLERIQRQGKDGFYSGKTAKLIADFMHENGGLITLEDLAKYEAVERDPIRGTYRGYEIVSMPPPSSGGIALVEMLNILEGYDLAAAGHNSALYLHLLTESMRRAYADRARYLGDPDFNPEMPVETLISKEHAASLRGSISLVHASVSDPALFAEAYESDQTTHLSVADKDGSMVSLTYTLEWGYGSHIVVEGAGFLLNNEMGDFNAMPGVTDVSGRIGTKPNRIRPEQRMLSSMTPTIVARNGLPVFATGTPGGKTIINTTLQTILNVIDHNMSIAESIEAGRIHHQWLPDRTLVEELCFSPDTISLYESLGHSVRRVGSIGSAMGVYHDRENAVFLGAADSRAEDGAAVSY